MILVFKKPFSGKTILEAFRRTVSRSSNDYEVKWEVSEFFEPREPSRFRVESGKLRKLSFRYVGLRAEPLKLEVNKKWLFWGEKTTEWVSISRYSFAIETLCEEKSYCEIESGIVRSQDSKYCFEKHQEYNISQTGKIKPLFESFISDFVEEVEREG
jgi:hypothetical protein